MTSALTFTVAFAALAAGHQAADYWVQSDRQATRKGLPGRPGRRACLAHVGTYHATLAGFLALAAGVLAVPVSTPLRRLAVLLGKGEYWDAGGAAPMDQAWHWCWLFAAALVIAA